MLAARARELSLCVYCPKLCRSECPVSNAEPRESLTPWGKMSAMYFVADQHVQADPSFTNLAWACTGCEACKNSCDHKNPVADTLGLARAAIFAAGKAPPAAARVAKLYAERKAELGQRVAQAKARHGLADNASVGIVAGCTYLRRLPDVADDVIAAANLLAGPATLTSSCCGGALAMAGDAEGQRRELECLANEARGMRLLVVGDPGCAYAIKKGAATHGIAFEPRIVTLVELAATHVTRLSPFTADGAPRDTPLFGPQRGVPPHPTVSSARDASLWGPPMFHDPCHLGRGLGLVSEPRAILTRLYGAPPREMHKNREHTACSGGGGLLPLTMPEVSQEIAKGRSQEAEGQLLVTACAQSLRAFRKAGARVEDLATLIARGLGKSHHAAKLAV